MKLLVIDGEVIDHIDDKNYYVALFERTMSGVDTWSISGVIYDDIDKIVPNLFNFNPNKVIAIRFKFPK